MHDKSALLKKLEIDIRENNQTSIRETAEAIVASGMNVMEAINLASAMITDIGAQFQRGEIYLPQLMLAGETMKVCMSVLSKNLGPDYEIESKGKVVLGAVAGDIHDIGKNLVASMMTVNGYEVIDIGVDAAPMQFVDTAQHETADIIAMSSLMTTSMPHQRDVLNLLNEMGVRGDYYVLVGGGPVTPEFADEIGADGWGLNAVSAVQVCDRLIKEKKQPSSGALVLVD